VRPPSVFSFRGAVDERPLDDIIIHAANADGSPVALEVQAKRTILVSDFEARGSDYDHRAHERARIVLARDQAGRAAELWPLPVAEAETRATAAGQVADAPMPSFSAAA